MWVSYQPLARGSQKFGVAGPAPPGPHSQRERRSARHGLERRDRRQRLALDELDPVSVGLITPPPLDTPEHGLGSVLCSTASPFLYTEPAAVSTQ